MRKLYMSLMVVMAFGLCSSAFAGTAFIPIWQHGYGVTYFNNLINTDASTATMTITLYDVINTATYTTTSTVAPMTAWLSDTNCLADGWYCTAGGAALGFGWGKNEGNGTVGTMYAWGAIYGTVSGKIVGLTVLAPETGF